METKAKLPKKLLSMFLAVLMTFSCFSIVMPELVPEANAAASTAQINALINAFKAADAATSGYSYSESGSTITDTTDKGYVYNIADALFTVVNGEKGSYTHNRTMRDRVKSLCSSNGYTIAGNALTLLNKLIPSSGNYNTYYNSSNTKPDTKTNTSSKWSYKHASHTYPSAPLSATSFSTTVKRTVKQAVLSDFSTVPATGTSVKTAVKMTYSAKVSTSNDSPSCSGPTWNGIYTCKCTIRAWYYNDSTGTAKSYTSTGTTPDLSAITAYLNHVAQDADSFKSGYTLYADEATRAQLIDYGSEKLATIYDNYYGKYGALVSVYTDADGIYRVNVDEKGNTVYLVDSAYISKFIGDTAVKNYTAYADYCNSLVEASKFAGHVNWIVTDGYEDEESGLAKNDYLDITDLQNTIAAADRAKLQSLYDLANKLYSEIEAVEGMFDALEGIYGVDIKKAYEDYIELIKDEIQKFDLRVIKDKAEFRYNNEDTAEYGSEEGNLWGIKGFEKYEYDVIGEECPISDLELQSAYSWYSAQYQVIKSKDEENRVAVFGDANASYIIDIVSELEAEIRYREIEVEYTELWNYFELARSKDYTLMTYEYVAETIDTATAKRAELAALYNELVTDYSQEEADFIFGNYLQIVDEFIESLKLELKSRVEKMLDDIKPYAEQANAGTLKIDFSNFVLIKTYVNAVDHELYKEVNGRGLVTPEYQAVYNSLDKLLKMYEDFVATGGLGSFRQNHYHDANGNYTTRYAGDQGVDADGNQIGFPNDIARDGEKDNYVVTEDKVETTISKLNSFVVHDDFGELIGLENADGEVTNLPSYIEELLSDSLFTNDTVNMLIGMLYPEISKMLEDTLNDLIATGLGNMAATPTDSKATGAISMSAAIGSSAKGTLNLYLDTAKYNGTQYQKSYPEVFKQLGLNLHPYTLAQSLASYNSSKYGTSSEIYKALNAAGRDWDKFILTEDLYDEEGNLLKSAGEMHIDFDWGVTDYNSFVTACSAVFNGVLPLLQTAFGRANFSKTATDAAYAFCPSFEYKVIWWLNLGKLAANCDVDITINALNLYGDKLIPLFEALGVTDGVDTNCDGVFEGGYKLSAISDTANASQLTKAVFDPIYALINQVKDAPIHKILEILPSLSYVLSMGMIEDAVNSMNISLGYSITGEIDYSNTGTIGDVAGALDSVFGFLENIVSGSYSLPLSDMINLSEMLGFDLSNLNDIIKFVMSEVLGMEDVTLPTINPGEIIECSSFKYVSSARTTGQRRQFVADKADVLYYLLQYLIDAIGDREFVEGIVATMGATDEENFTIDTDGDGVLDAAEPVELPELLYKIIDCVNHNPMAALAALVELFVPQEYSKETIDWVAPQYNYNGIEGMNKAALVYLDYSNDWTKEKATYLIDNIDALAESILEMTGAEETQLNALIQKEFDKLFTNENITGIIKGVASLGKLLGYNDAIYGIIDGVGADLKAMYNAFGYLFVTEEDRATEGFVEPPKPGDEGYNAYLERFNIRLVSGKPEDTTTDENGNPVYNYTWSYKDEVFTDGNKEVFVELLCESFAGFAGLLGAFFRGENIGIFNDAIEFIGYENYADSIGLFFELLGIEGAMSQEAYVDFCNDNKSETDPNGDIAALNYTINTLFDWIDGYLLKDNTIKKVLEILPNFIYFVESNGLSVVLHNLLMPVLVLIDTIRPIYDLDLNLIVSYLVSDFVNYGEIKVDILQLLEGIYVNDDLEYKFVPVDLGHLTVTEIVKIVDAILGTDLAGSQLGTFGLDGFCSGVVEYDSVITTEENGLEAFKSTIDAPDALTILVSALLEAVEYETESGATNGEIICDFIQEMMGEPEEGEEPVDVKAIYTMVIDLIQGVSVEYQVPDWGYMLGYEIDDTETTITLPEHTINYLDYSTDWTEDKAIAVENTLDDVIKMILETATEDENATIATLLNGVFNDNVYTDANLTIMVEGIVNLIGGLDETLRNTIDVVIDTDMASWFEMCDAVEGIDEDGNATVTYKVKADKDWGVDSAAAEDKREMFVTGLYEVLMPAQRLLSWFLFGDDFAFFTGTEKNDDGSYKYNDIITLTGGRAYDFGLVPILEALGIEMPKAETFYVAVGENEGYYNVGLAIDTILESVFDLIDEVSANPTKGVLDLLVNVLYFINADGVKTSVNNILAPIDALIAKVAPMIDELEGKTSIAALLTETVEFDISDLSMGTILGLLYEKANIVMSDEMYGILCTFYVGELQQFESANGNYAYRLAYTDEECYHDMLTIVLAFAIDLVKQNETVFTEMLGENGAQIYAAIKALLTPYELTYGDINWGYMYGNEAVADNTAALETAGKFKPVEKFQYLKYATDWSPEMANDVYAQLNDVISFILNEYADGNSIAQLLKGVMEDNVYTEANLKTVVELLVNALASLDRSLADTIGILLDADISTWFSFCEEQVVDGETKYVCTKVWGVDEAADKKAVFVAAIREILEPANRLLNWLFFEGSFTFFKDATGETLITITGGKGYELGLVPILEALGCEPASAESFYDEEAKTYDVGAAVESILDKALALVDKISENPSKEAMTLIPNLLYFINADGLKTSVNNLLAPVEVLLSAFGGLIPELGEGATLSSLIGFELDNLSTETLLGLLEGEDVGLVMNDDMKAVIKNIFALGTADDFTSVNGKTAYRVDVTGKEYDVLTVVLSFAIDAFKLNKALFADLLPAGVYDAVVALIAGLNIDVDSINWAYMYSGNMAELERSGFPAATITYLDYTTDWTAEAADSVYGVLAEILDLVLPSVIEDGDLKKLVTDLIAGNLYKTENLETIVELIVNAIAGFDVSLRNVVDAVLDVNIASWFAMCELKDGKYEVKPGTLKGDTREDFIAGLKTVLEPANELLNWLFFGESYTFFNGTTSEVLITVNGGKGYAYGILPILEAIGVEGLQKEYRDANGKFSAVLAVEDILNKVLDLVDAKLTSTEATVEFAFTLIPNLLYFINSDGLKASVNNLVAPVDAIIGCLSDVVGAESLAALLTETIGFDISNLETRTLLGLLETELGFVMNAGMRGAIYNIYEVGEAEKFTSVSGKTAYRLVADKGDALTVILSFALDAFNLNEELFVELLKDEKIYDTVATLIKGLEVLYTDINWGYMYEKDSVEANNKALAENGFPAVSFQYLKYATDWTEETADAVYGELNDVLAYLLGEIAGGNTIAQLLSGVLNDNVYTDANLNAIVELIVNAIFSLDEGLIEIVGGADSLLDADINTWKTMCTYNEETGKYECTKAWGVDGAADEKAAFVAGLKEVLAPANELLAWLFFEDDYTFLNGTTNNPLITISGGKGYALGLVPILEALGCELAPAESFYDEETKTYDVGAAVESILDSALALVDKVSANPSKEAMTLIPNLLYFINADGLKESVNNLLAPVNTVISALSGIVDVDRLGALLEETVGFNIENLDTETLLGLLVEKTGFIMNDDMKQVIYDIYGLGTADDFTSVNGKTAYRVDVTGKEYDVLTVVLSFAIDAFKLNKALFADLLPAGVYDAVVALIAGLNIDVDSINWAYMYSGNMAELERSGFPATKLAYLEYSTDWTEDAADSVYGVLAEILDLVLPSVIEDGDLKKLVTDLIAGNLYKTENLETIVELLVNLLADFDESLRNVVDAVLDVNIADWFAMCKENADGKWEVIPGTLSGDNKEDFIAGLKTVLEPANELLAWLFFGEQYTFFNGTTSEVLITVNGGKGYAYGIVPILEALGLEMKKAEAYKGADGKYDVGAAVEDIINAVLSIVDKLDSSEATVEYVFTLIPNLLYFINSDGLKASVNNLVAPVDAIIGCLSDVVGTESLAALLTETIGFDISNLETRTLLGLLETELGFVMNAGMRGAIYQIYATGEAEKFTSVNGKTAYRLVADKGDVLTVILSFALDAFNLNEELFSDLLGEEEYKAVYNLIRGAQEQFIYAEPNWGYMYEGGTEELAANSGKLPKYPASSTAATYLLYKNNWNKDTAVYVNEVVDAVVAGIMGETSLGQMLDNAIANGFYTDDILNSLISMVVGLVVDYAEIIEGAGVLLGAESIYKWFDYCTIAEDGTVTVTHDFGIDEAGDNDAKREKFVEAFVEVLEPAYRLLSWLLFDQDFTFFNGTTNDPLITITGGRGYEEALVPLFEAVGAKMPGLEDKKYENGETAMRPAAYYELYDEATGDFLGYDMEAVVRDLFSALTDWLYMLCGNLDNQGEYGVIGAMLDLLPNVVYNINAGTVKAVVNNLLVPVEEILGHLEAFGFTVDFSTLLEIRGRVLDITNLDWYAVFDILESFGLYWPENIQDFLATLYIGEAVEFTSANGKTAYYMTYNADDVGDYLVSGREDMITLLVSFVIDAVLDTRNAPRLSGWLGEDAYNVIYRYLANEIVKVPMQDVNWQLTEYADTDTVVSPITLGAKINSEFYGELYTREMGEYIEKWLPSFVDTMIVLLGVQGADGVNYEGLADILNELIGTSLYTKENLQKILELIQGLLPKAEEALGAELYEVVVNVLRKALDIDLTYWNDYTVADIETGDREAFVDELTRMLTPLYPILSWLLTDEDLIALFYTAEGRDAVVIEGAEGYAYGIIPLLEAFDYDSELILTPDEFKAASTDAPSMLRNILNPVLDVVDTVLADPVNEIFNVLPGVIYFLNSNGLDTVIKNTANAVFTVLENIEPITGEIDVYELIGFDAENINIETLISELIKGLEEDTGFQLTEVAMEALTELTVGTVKSFESKNGKTAYTVEYATGADRVDMVTVVLRLVLTFVSIPENVVALEGMLEGKLDEEGYKFVCSLLENFSQMAASEGGMDEIMYTVYQIFYAANVAAHSTEDWLAEFNGDYSFLNQLFATSDLEFLRQIEISLGDLLNKYTGDIIDDDEIVPNGFIAFFQKIAEFFKKIGEFFKNLFK